MQEYSGITFCGLEVKILSGWLVAMQIFDDSSLNYSAAGLFMSSTFEGGITLITFDFFFSDFIHPSISYYKLLLDFISRHYHLEQIFY